MIPTGREAKAIIITVKQKIRLPIVDLTSFLKEEKQYSAIRAGEVNMSYDGGSSLQEWWIG